MYTKQPGIQKQPESRITLQVPCFVLYSVSLCEPSAIKHRWPWPRGVPKPAPRQRHRGGAPSRETRHAPLSSHACAARDVMASGQGQVPADFTTPRGVTARQGHGAWGSLGGPSTHRTREELDDRVGRREASRPHLVVALLVHAKRRIGRAARARGALRPARPEHGLRPRALVDREPLLAVRRGN